MATNNSIQLSANSVDETGNVYGKLTVERFVGRSLAGDSLWECRCKCGNLTTVARGDMRKSYGGTKSCGCGRKTQGGGYSTTEYTTWKEMKRRCYNTKYKEYPLYGGRGIEICEQWRTSFPNFLADMGLKPFPDATIDRIDNNGHYEPGNCRWATKLQQSQNSRKARMLTYNGETHCLREWGRILGITHATLRRRIAKGWPIEQAFSSTHYVTSGISTRRKTVHLL